MISVKKVVRIYLFGLSLPTQLLLAQSNFWEQTSGPLGRIASLAVHPSGVVLVATGISGVLRSTDEGNHWVQTSLNSYISNLLIDRNGLVYASGNSFYYSEDAGQSWVKRGTTNTIPASLAIDSTGILYAGTVSGNPMNIDQSIAYMNRSTDSASTWTTEYIGRTKMDIMPIVILPNGSVLVATYQHGMFRSSTGVADWAAVPNNLTMMNALAVVPSGRIFGGSYDRGAIFFSTNSGDSWSPLLLVGTSTILAFRSFVFTTGTTDVYMSVDEGKSWGRMNSGLAGNGVTCFAMSSGGRVFAGTSSGGVYRSIAIVTGAPNSETMPNIFNLSQNYPNPLNPSTTIEYSIPSRQYINLTIFDLLGKEVASLANEIQQAGSHKVIWNGKNRDGSPLTSGVYYYQLRGSGFVETKKLILLK